MATKIPTVYGPILDGFVKQLAQHPNTDYVGIPHPFLPEVGRNYDHALVPMAVVGKETRGWGTNLDRFIPDYLANGFDFDAEMAEFRNLDFKGSNWMGGKPTCSTFWGTAMNILSKCYGFHHWKEFQQGKHDIILDSFAWGNVNSIETSTSAGVNPNAPGYNRAKSLSEQMFDSVDLLIRAVAPRVILLFCSIPERNRYLGSGFTIVEVVENKVTVLRRDGVLVFHAPHPNKQRWYSGGADEFARIIRDLLVKYKLFCPLPNVLQNGLSATSQQILVAECTGISTFDAIAKVAHELRKQRSYMTARSLCLDVLNPAGHKTQRGTPYTGKTQGPCRLVATAWDYFQNTVKRPDIAEDIALAFTDIHGNYAYEK